MRVYFFAFLLFFSTLRVFAQDNQAVSIKSTDSLFFTLFLNGVNQNQEADTFVLAENLSRDFYIARIEFTDSSIQPISASIQTKENIEIQYKLSFTESSGYALEKRNEVNLLEEMVNDSQLTSKLPTATKGSQSKEITVDSTTDSLHTDSLKAVAKSAIDGYTGRIGCGWPLEDEVFSEAIASINTQVFEYTKLSYAKEFVDSHCFTTKQVKQLVEIFSFEDSKLEFCKVAYSKIHDIENFDQVQELFDFEMTKRDLHEYIQAQY